MVEKINQNLLDQDVNNQVSTLLTQIEGADHLTRLGDSVALLAPDRLNKGSQLTCTIRSTAAALPYWHIQLLVKEKTVKSIHLDDWEHCSTLPYWHMKLLVKEKTSEVNLPAQPGALLLRCPNGT